MDFIKDNRVWMCTGDPFYCNTPPFHPAEEFPEFKGMPVGNEPNPAFSSFRKLLKHMRLDYSRIGTEKWNPLSDIVASGDTVIIKPNFVTHKNSRKNSDSQLDLDCLITHGSVVRVVVDYVCLALKNSGKIIIGDCPIQGTNWKHLIKVTGLNSLKSYVNERYPSVTIELNDYRLWRSIYKNGTFISGEFDKAAFENQQEIDLKRASLLIPLMGDGVEFGVPQYPREKMREAHTPNVNKYICPKDFLNADVFINLAKMKVHMKAGVTCAMKNLVGINGHKDYLPHFRFGSPEQGGDEYPDGNYIWNLYWSLLHRSWDAKKVWSKSLLQRVSRFVQLFGYLSKSFDPVKVRMGGGGWAGNDTLWRTILDINRAFFYFDNKSKKVSENISLNPKYITFLDGIVGGHKFSPLHPEPVLSGYMLSSYNPLSLDTVATALMGIDYRKIKQINEGYNLTNLPLADFQPHEILIDGDCGKMKLNEIYEKNIFTKYEVSDGWVGYV